MYKNKTVIQIGSHIGNTQNDPIYNEIDESTILVLVEPVPYLFIHLINNYKVKLHNLTNVTFINKAVSDFVGEINMTAPSERNDFTTLPFWASQLASINTNHATGHIHNLLVDTIKVRTTTIDEIIREHKIRQIDLLHTDTEGHDFRILMNYSFKIKPRQILFENKHMDGLLLRGYNYKMLSDRLESLGYTKKYENDEDTMYELPL